MITEGLLNVVKNLVLWFINLIPAPEITELNLSGVIDNFISILQSVAYILPVGDILIMLGIWFGINTFSIAWRLIQRIWDAIPFI